MIYVEELIRDFDDFETKSGSKMKQLISLLDEKYEYDYIVFAVAENIINEEKIWEMRYSDLIKHLMFKKFNAYIQDVDNG